MSADLDQDILDEFEGDWGELELLNVMPYYYPLFSKELCLLFFVGLATVYPNSGMELLRK